MWWFEIAVFLVLFQSMTIISGQLIFPDDDYPDTDLQNRQQFRQPQQQFLLSNQQQNENGRRRRRPRPRPRPTPQSGPPGTTTTAQPASLTECRANCSITSQYNPVCGTDGQTYNNMSVLRCAQDCGINVEFRRLGICVPRG